MMSPADPLLSIVIPAFNEERRLPRTLEALAAHCRGFECSWEIIAVVEQSSDRTVEVASAVASTHPEISVIANQLQRGKGFALRTGVGLSSGAIVLTMDADLSVPVEFIDTFMAFLDKNQTVDIVVGNRRHPDAIIETPQSFPHKTFGELFSRLARVVGVSNLPDTQCGFKAMRRAPAIEIYSRQTIDGFACDVEILLLAEQMGFEIRDLPVRWTNSLESKVRLFRDNLRMLWDVLRVRRRVARTLAALPYHAPVREEQSVGQRER
ncbi:MAG TPA: glycosyltransferase [Opitutaceae bacterium]